MCLHPACEIAARRTARASDPRRRRRGGLPDIAMPPSLTAALVILQLHGLVAVVPGSVCLSEPAIILTETSGAVTNARTALSSWALGVDSRLPGLDKETGISYALDHSAGLVMSRHDIMEYGCQGSLVAEKLLAYSLGYANVSTGCGRNGFGIIRQQLLATPQCVDGKSFAGEDHEYHRGYAGSFEATAEMILTARTFYAHTADQAAFMLNPERLLCVTPADGGSAVLVGAISPGLTSAICSESPVAVARLPHVFSDNTNAPTAVTQTTHLTAHGKSLLAFNISIDISFESIRLPLIQRGSTMWPFSVSLTRQDASSFGRRVCQQTFNTSLNRQTWLSISCSSSLPAGQYTVEVRPQLPSETGLNPKDSYVYSVGWLTNARPKTSGSAAHRSISDAGSDDHNQDLPLSDAAGVYPLRLFERLRRAMEWQLKRSRRQSGAYGVFVLGSHAAGDPSIFRGSARRGSFGASGWYDQLKIGWKSAYHNLLFLRSLLAFHDLEQVGLVEPLPAPHPPVPNISAAVAEDIYKQLITKTGRVISWIACDSSDEADCDVLSVDAQQPTVDIGLISAQAMAASVMGQAQPKVVSHLQQMVDEARLAPGKFRTNLRPVESFSPRLFGPSDKWLYVDSSGFAERIVNQTGDWQMFRNPADGYGNFGNHQQNGGALLSDSAFVFAVGSTGTRATAMLRDWQGLVEFVSAARDTILMGPAAAKAGQPIVPTTMSAYLRPRTADGGVVQQLCVAARSHDSRHNATSTDWWGHTQCQYYNEVQWSLVSGSVSIHSFVVGLLGLKIPLQSAQSEPPSVSMFGVRVALGAGIVAVPLPLTTAWPSSVARVKVDGMAVAGSVGLELSCVKKQSLKCQLVHTSEGSRMKMS